MPSRSAEVTVLRGTVFAIALIGVLSGASVSDGQQPAKIARVGVLTLSVGPSTPIFEGFRRGLREHGYVDGQNIIVEFRFAEGRPERLPAMAAELVNLKVDVIVIESVVAARAAKQATDVIPLVTAVHGDPVGAGLAASLARPGGNVTGLSLLALELSSKRLQLLREIAPKATRVAVIWNAANPVSAGYLAESQTAGRQLGLQLYPFEVRSPTDLDLAFNAVAAVRPSAVMTLPDGMLLAHRARILDFVTKNRFPAIFPDREFAESGGLLAYGPNLTSHFRRAVAFVDKILKGAKPGDLPIEQPTEFELVVHLKTAKALGLTIPQSMLLGADKVIE